MLDSLTIVFFKTSLFCATVNLAIFNSTMEVTEADGAAEVCIVIDAEIERPIIVSPNAMSISATGIVH